MSALGFGLGLSLTLSLTLNNLDTRTSTSPSTSPSTIILPKIASTPKTSVIKCLPEDPKQCAVDMNMGDATPFAGTLLSTELALSLFKQVRDARALCALNTKRLGQRHQAELKRQEDHCTAKLTAGHKREASLTEQLQEAQPGFWAHPAVISTGTLLGVAAIVTAVWLATKPANRRE